MIERKAYTDEEIDLGLTVYCLEGGRGKRVVELLDQAGLEIPLETLRGWAYRYHPERYERIKSEVDKQVRGRMADQFHRIAALSGELSEDVLHRMKAGLEKRDSELAEADRRLEDCRDQLREVEAQIDAAQARLGESLGDATTPLEELAADADTDVDLALIAEVQDLWKRREALTQDAQTLWKRRAEAEVDFRDLAKLLHEAGVASGIATEKFELLNGRPTSIVENTLGEIQRGLEQHGVKLLVGAAAVLPPSGEPEQPEPVPVESRPALPAPA